MAREVRKDDEYEEFYLPGKDRFKAVIENLAYQSTNLRRYSHMLKGVRGELTFRQGNWLFEAAKTGEGNILEIGGGYGQSTVCLALGLMARKRSDGILYAVEPHRGFVEESRAKAERGDAGALEPLMRNLVRFRVERKVEPIGKSSKEALKRWNGSAIKLMFIMSPHTEESLRHDLTGWAEYVSPGATIAVYRSEQDRAASALHEAMEELKIPREDLHHFDGELAYFKKR